MQPLRPTTPPSSSRSARSFSPATAPNPAALQDRARAYLGRMPASISGQGGHRAAFAAAVALVRGFSLGEAEALDLLREWNTRCQPVWTEAELRHKLRSAATSGTRTPGYLLQNDRPQSNGQGHGGKRAPLPSPHDTASPAPDTAPTPATPAACETPQSVPEFIARLQAEAAAEGGPETGRTMAIVKAFFAASRPATPPLSPEAERKAQQRAAWPEFRRLTHDDIRRIAAQRHMLPDAVDLAHRWGFLNTAVVEGHPCYLINEGPFAQARRLDGQPLVRHDGTLLKARNLQGSVGAFLGRRWTGQTPNVLLVEGCIGFLEALAAFALVDMQGNWSLLAATSASSRFARDPDLLERLRGRRVRIVPDGDDAGANAAASWKADLQGVGARVEVFPLPPGIKDLGTLIKPLPEVVPAALTGTPTGFYTAPDRPLVTPVRQRILDALFS